MYFFKNGTLFKKELKKEMGAKIWTEAEVNKILDFLADNRHFEVTFCSRIL